MEFTYILRIFFHIKIHCKSISNASLNAEFNALIEYVSSHSSEPNWKNTSIHTDSNANSYIFRIFVDIKIHCKSIWNASLDAQYNALKEYVLLIEGTHMQKPEKKRLNNTDFCAIAHILPLFFSGKIHSKNTLNASLNAEFNAPKEYVVLIEATDLQNLEKSKEHRWNHTD